MTSTIATIPSHNESHTIAKIILGCNKYVDKVIVIDDGSSDDTAKKAQSLGASVVKHTEHLGYVAALNSCFNTARELGADAMILIDLDGQHNLDEIPKLLAPLKQGFDLVIGSRFNNSNGKNVPTYRNFGMKFLDFATYKARGIEVTDYQSDFHAYGKKAIEKIHINGGDMSVDSEILLKAKDYSLKFIEVKIHCLYEVDKCSSQNLFVHAVRVLMRDLNEMEYRRPLYCFAVPGILIETICLYTDLKYLQYFHQGENLNFGLTLLMISLTIAGMFMVFTGIILHEISKLLFYFKWSRGDLIE